MKKLILLLAMALSLGMNEAKSQTSNPVHFGIKGGGNFTDLSISKNGVTSQYSPGYSAGVFTSIDIKKWYVQGEISYAHHRSKVKENTHGKKKVDWNSIEIPVLAGYRFYQKNNITLRFFGGGVYSYVLNNNASALHDINATFKDFNKSSIGYQTGVGIDIGKFMFELKSGGALIKTSKEFNSKPQSLQASVGFMIF